MSSRCTASSLGPASPAQADLRVEAHDLLDRHREPITCGVPWPAGALCDTASLRLRDVDGNAVPLQVRTLDRWSDGSVRWALLDWQADLRIAAEYDLVTTSEEKAANVASHLLASCEEGRIIVDTQASRFELAKGSAFPFALIVGGPLAIDARFTVEDEKGRHFTPEIRQLRLDENGPIRAAVCLEGELVSEGIEPLLEFIAHLHFFTGSPTVRIALTLRNPRKADHPGGLWDLGNGGSIFIRDAAFTVGFRGTPGKCHLRCSHESGMPFEPVDLPFELYQDSSGGPNWRSSNHVNRRRVVPNSFRGYRLRSGTSERSGLRATPVLTLTQADAEIALTMPYFWQNFPKSAEASNDTLTLRLFPRQYADVHEFQGGEQKTHEIYVAFGRDQVTHEPVAWAREPARARAAPEWYCASGAVPYLTPKASDSNSEYLRLVDAALDGADTFEHKREVIDEYGWRHFGDIYGDHEAVFHKGPTPLVSHYNNQYDPVAGFGYQFLRSGDQRWLRQMAELAAHVIDIDLYHTDRDKAAYNHGLFWHTFHYVDADTGTHRSYPKAASVCGGGPGNEQNYATGLMLHYYLTGSEPAREAALALARWVIDMDDGNRTVFRWLVRGDTGLASASRTPDYHGPGRGAANSIAALLDGHRLSGDQAFLAKAEQLIRRCIHPDDNVPSRHLLDAENRWFYTMFLQSLGRYLDYKIERGQLDFHYAYARASLLHYARWMAAHEYPYLDKPEILEYPTETWAAQDMRKSEIFKYAAKHATGQERERFLERADFFFRSCTTTLAGMKTRTLARPVVLLLSYGYMQAYFQQHPDCQAPAPTTVNHDFGRPMVFVPQKARALKRLRALVVAAAAAGLLGLAILAGILLR